MRKYGKMTLDEIEATINKLGGPEACRKLRSGELTVSAPTTPPLLKVLDTVDLPAISRFVATDACTKANGIAWLGGNFRRVMLPLVEENIAAATLTIHELVRGSRDLRIAAELNVDDNGPVSLAHFLYLLSKQAKGESGPLRADGSNTAYVLGPDGNIWAVDAFLDSVGWYVDADSLSRRHGWDAGGRFLSR